MRQLAALTALSLSVSAVYSAEPVKAPKQGFSAEFTLQDQHAKERSWKFPRERASVLVVSDHAGSSQIEAWVAPIYKQYEKDIDIAGLAALPGIPSPFHGLFRREFRKRLTYPVLLDWSGEVSKHFTPKAGVANVYVVGRDGRIKVEKSGVATEEALKEITQALDKLSK